MRMAGPLHEKKIIPVRKVFTAKSARGQEEQAIKISTRIKANCAQKETKRDC